MRFDLVDLRLFLNVHEAGSITAGAAACHMTLASASERIRGMEQALGVPLLLRRRQGVDVTPAGRTLVRHARQVLQQMACLHDELGEFGAGLKAYIRLHCNTSALSEHLPGMLGAFLAEHPGVSVELEESSSDEIADAIRNDACDIGIVSDAADLDGLESFVFRDDPLALVVAQGDALAGRKQIAFADVAGRAFVGLAADSALETLLARQARRLGKSLNYRVRLRSFESVCRMVGSGIGVAVVPRAVAMRCARSAKIRPLVLSDAWASRQLRVCVRQLAALPGPARQMVQMLLASASS
jgi:DNA-binding transcriptional LysR family regulator